MDSNIYKQLSDSIVMVEQCFVYLAVLYRRTPIIRNRVLACHVLNPEHHKIAENEGG